MILAAPVLVVLLLAYSLFADGFMLATLWKWYAVPLGMQPIHWHVFAVGVGAWQCVRYSANGKKDDRGEDDQAFSIILAIAYPWLVLLIAWWWL